MKLNRVLGETTTAAAFVKTNIKKLNNARVDVVGLVAKKNVDTFSDSVPSHWRMISVINRPKQIGHGQLGAERVTPNNKNHNNSLLVSIFCQSPDDHLQERKKPVSRCRCCS